MVALQQHTSDCGPQCRNGLDVFVQRERETVHFLLILHDEEWIVRWPVSKVISSKAKMTRTDIAEELDGGLYPPVVVVVGEKRVMVEKLGPVSTIRSSRAYCHTPELKRHMLRYGTECP